LLVVIGRPDLPFLGSRDKEGGTTTELGRASRGVGELGLVVVELGSVWLGYRLGTGPPWGADEKSARQKQATHMYPAGR
jgi:hypothetical protein